MIGLLLINLYSACNPRLCAAECERHILGNRQETAEGRGGWSRGRRWWRRKLRRSLTSGLATDGRGILAVGMLTLPLGLWVTTRAINRRKTRNSEIRLRIPAVQLLSPNVHVQVTPRFEQANRHEVVMPHDASLIKIQNLTVVHACGK